MAGGLLQKFTAPAGDTAVSTFNFRGFDLRCVLIDGQPWFAVADACDALGIKSRTDAFSKLGSTLVSRRKLSTFNFRGFDLRCVEIDGQPWFCVRDICDALDINNSTHFISNLGKTNVSRAHLASALTRKPR